MIIAMGTALIIGVVVVIGEEYFKKLNENDEYASMIRKAMTPLIEDFNFVKRFLIRVKMRVLN